MKQSIVIKVAVAVTMMFTPFIVMADKLEIQDNRVIVLGKGCTDNKGVFTTTGPLAIDSIVIDEIVLTYKTKPKKGQILSITDSLTQKTIFSQQVINGMSTTEMKKLCFSLYVGHKYCIEHGSKQWEMTIPAPLNDDNSSGAISSGSGSNGTSGQNLAETNAEIKENTQEDTKANNIGFLWLLWLLVGVIVGGCIVGFVFRAYPTLLKHNEQSTSGSGNVEPDTGTGDEINDNGSVEEKHNEDINSGKEIKSGKEEIDPKEQKHKKTLQQIAVLLGLNEDQLQYQFFENKINELQKKSEGKDVNIVVPVSNGNKVNSQSPKELDIDAARGKIAKELLEKFQNRTVFKDMIEQAKKNCLATEYNILLQLFEDIDRKIRSLNQQLEKSASEKNEQSKDIFTIGDSDSHIEWLNKRLTELFHFDYNDKESVKENMERFIRKKAEGLSGNVKPDEPTIDIEKVIKERLDKEKAEWESKSKKEKETELKGKNTEIENLKTQLGTKDNEITGLTTRLENTTGEIADLNSQIEGKKAEIKGLKDKYKQEQQAGADALADKLHRYVDMIEWRPMLDPCDNDEGIVNQCVDIEDRLNKKLKEMKERLYGFTAAKEATSEMTFKAIQERLVSEITVEESVVNSLCRLYAYSQLPFMTDIKREYGVRLRRKNVNEIYEALENLYVQFGIKFQLPSLFVMESKDGDYENVTGQAYSELNNLCPNVNNHCDNIDSSMKLKDVIVDIDKIGYTVDGVVLSKARILTF